MNQDVIEIQEAIEAGEDALRSLEDARKELGTARGLGFWDIFGGGMIASMLKRDRMMQAQYRLRDAQEKLRDFSKELNDINAHVNFDLGMDVVSGTLDIFFDNMFVDIMVQRKIHNAVNAVDQAIDHVNQILDELEQLMEKALEADA